VNVGNNLVRAGCFLFFWAALVIGAVAFFLVLAPNMLLPPPNTGGGGDGGGDGDQPAGTVTYRGTDGSGDLPIISIREFTGGEAPITTSGTFDMGQTMPMDPPAAHTDGVDTTIVYGDLLSDYVELAFSRVDGSEGIGVNVQSGDWLAVYLGQGCSWEVDVSANLVSGHISCTDIPATNQADGSTGAIDVEVDFTADSVPVEGGSAGSDGG
jgi:hypothetical protein